MEALIGFVGNIVRHYRMIYVMARHEFVARFAGTLGGSLWAIFHPLVTVIVFWFVFSVGLKVQDPSGMPFVLYFVSGLVPWLIFSEILTASANGVTANAHLVKKVNFPTEVLPLVYIIAACFSHAVFLALTFLLLFVYGFGLSLHVFLLLYYFFALVIFALGISWLVSALNVFHRDIGQGLTIILNLWFWLTPIAWPTDMVPAAYRWMILLNPVGYVVDGYRKALFYQHVGWLDISSGLYYWLMVGFIFLLGATVFRRLKPDFADVL